MKLYKYTNLSVLEYILTHKKIRFTQAIAFNDPFDVLPILVSPFAPEDIKSMLSSYCSDPTALRQSLNEFANEQFASLPVEFKSLIHSPGALVDFIESALRAKGRTWESVLHQYVNPDKMNESLLIGVIHSLRNNLGILSLTTVPDNLLMWAHYADSHAGVVMEFNGDHAFFSKMLPEFPLSDFEVAYTNKRPVIKIQKNHLTEHALKVELLRALFLTKSIDWAYERELRILRPLAPELMSNTIDSMGHPIYLYNLPSECIRAVTFGCRATNDDILKFRPMCLSHGICVSKAQIDKNHFKLNFVELPN